MSSRRGVGLGAFASRTGAAQAYTAHGSNLKSANAESLKTQREVIQQLLHNFAIEHADAIKSNPTFRAEFARMCHAVGVDPAAGTNLTSKSKNSSSLRAKVFGPDLNDFYCSVAVRIVDLCRRTRAQNGGLIGLSECRDAVAKGQAIGGGLQVSEDDIVQAVKSLKVLHGGYDIIEMAHKRFVRSVPRELNTDQSEALEFLQFAGSMRASDLVANLRWETARAGVVIEDLLAEGLIWVDKQCARGEWEYWSPQGLLDED